MEKELERILYNIKEKTGISCDCISENGIISASSSVEYTPITTDFFKGVYQSEYENRTYFKLLRQIIAEGQKTGQLRTDRTVNEILRAYALWERALLYDWCLSGGEYSLVSYSDTVTPMFLESYRGNPEETE